MPSKCQAASIVEVGEPEVDPTWVECLGRGVRSRRAILATMQGKRAKTVRHPVALFTIDQSLRLRACHSPLP